MAQKRVFTADCGYTVGDLLHFGYGHLEAALELYKTPGFMDSAGYLTQLGIELVLKAGHLHHFRQFPNSHNLMCLYKTLQANGVSMQLGAENEAFLADVDQFYQLRYPRANNPVEVGSDQVDQLHALMAALWQTLPDAVREEYDKLKATEKGGRILMRKRIDPHS